LKTNPSAPKNTKHKKKETQLLLNFLF